MLTLNVLSFLFGHKYYRGSRETQKVFPTLSWLLDVAIVLINILHREMLGGYSHGHPQTIWVLYFLYNQVKERNGNMHALFCGKLISTVFSVSQGRSIFPHLLGICEQLEITHLADCLVIVRKSV